jgi:hypothetical protein
MEVTVRLHGGLGNQIFQYAAGLALKKAMGSSAKLFFVMLEENPHNHLGHDYMSALFIQGTMFESKIHSYRYTQGKAFEVWYPDLLTNYTMPIYLDGYFQYLPAIAPSIPELRTQILTQLSKTTGLNYTPLLDTGFVHVRRGDYLKHPTFHWVQEAAYFEKGMKLIGLEKWVIFSDDIDWCRNQACFRGAAFAEEEDEMKALLVMSSCCGGAVISNSSFSWWAAMFGAHEYSGRVVYPEMWVEYEKPRLFPAEWLQLSSSS